MIFKQKQRHTLKSVSTSIPRPMNMSGREIDYAERSGAAFLPTFESHVIVPLSESVVSGVFLGIPVGLIVVSVSVIGKLGWGDGLIAGFITFIITTYTWAWWCWHCQLNGYDSLLWYTEKAEAPQQQEENRQTYDARVRVNNHWRHCDLPFDRDNPQSLVSFSKAVVSGLATFSEDGARQHNYSIERFRELRDGLLRGNLAYWKNEKNKRGGVGLTRGGLALLRSVAENPPSDDYEPETDNWSMSSEMIQK